MAYWLVKTDPDDYGMRELERDRSTPWTGVRNALAQRHLNAMKVGDELLLYHTGDERAVVAIGKVARAAFPDPTAKAPGPVAVEILFERWLKRPVLLSELRADDAFREFALIRNSRLSVMPASASEWKRIQQLSRTLLPEPG